MGIQKRVEVILKARDDASKVIDKFEQKTAKAARNLRKSGLIVGAAGAAMLAGLGATVKVAANFEDSMRRVAAVSGATGEEFDKLRNIALELGRTTRFTASEVSDGLFFLAQSGASVNEQLETIPDVLNLASASGLELGRTSDLLTDIMEAFGLEATESARAADVLAVAITSSSTDLEQLAQGMKFIAPQARAFGMDIEQTAAALGVLAEGGFKGSQGGTAMRQIMLKLLRTAPQTTKVLSEVAAMQEELGSSADLSSMEIKTAADVLTKYNIKVLDANGNIKNFSDIVREMTKAQISQQDAVKLFNTRLGQMDFLVRQGADSMDLLEGKMRNGQGAAKKMAITMEESLAGSLREFRSASEGLAISLGDVLIPTITKITKLLTMMVGALNSLPGPFKTVAVWGILVTGIVLTLGGGLAVLLSLLPQAAAGFLLLSKSIATMATVMTTKMIPAMIRTIVKIWAMVAARIALLAVSGPVGLALLAGGAVAAGVAGIAIGKASKNGLPSFRHGGVVPGAANEEVPIMAHGGEQFLGAPGTGGGRGGGAITINLSVGAMLGKEEDARQLARLLHRFLRDDNRTRLTGRNTI